MTRVSEKICPTCGRSFAWRKKWARDWAHVRFCSDRCRRGRGGDEAGRALEAAILDLLDRRAPGATICPSEAARAVAAGSGPDDWRGLMNAARAAARRLVRAGRLQITQKGRVVDPDEARGPIRLRRVR